MQVNVIMPMGGGGTRFWNNGFEMPKPMIEINGKPFLYWATKSLTTKLDVASLIFVVLQDHIDKFNIDTEIKKYFPEAIIVALPRMLQGATLTCLEGVKIINNYFPIIFNDCDHAFLCDELVNFFNSNESMDCDAALVTFKSQNPNYSYIRHNDDGDIVGTIEKVVVSDDAICGAYIFRDVDIFRKGCDMYLKNCAYKEFFVSGVYNALCDCNFKVINFTLDHHITFGTPEEYNQAISNPFNLDALNQLDR